MQTSTRQPALVPALLAAAMLLPAADSRGGRADESAAEFKAQFLKLCDVARQDLNSPARRLPFYQDSYAVRALAAAYDLTGRQQYLEACTSWCDRMLQLQQRMTPAGAYYMNYGRKPGQDQGDWYVADSCSIAMGVLATAARCRDAGRRRRYLGSVRAFAKLVMDNYIERSGGVTDGLWSRYSGPWWCSSGLFASLSFLLHQETGEARYRAVALGAIDWLNRLDLHSVKHISFDRAAPAVIMYVLEAYSAGLPYLEPGSARHQAAVAQINRTLHWMADNQQGRGASTRWDYQTQWGSKLGGLPFHMYVLARHLPDGEKLSTAADQELRYLWTRLRGQASLSQLMAFSLISYAERVRPGAIYRTGSAR